MYLQLCLGSSLDIAIPLELHLISVAASHPSLALEGYSVPE